MMEQGAAAHLVFLFELLCGTKVQQAHVDQLLEVLVESKDVPPEGRSRTVIRLAPSSQNGDGMGGWVTSCTAAASSCARAAIGPGSAA